MEYDIKKLLFIFVFSILLMGLVEGYVQNQTLDIRHSIRIDGAPNSNISANITVVDPDNDLLVLFQKMTYNSNSEQHNYTIDGNNLSKIGTYCYDITAGYNGINQTNSFCFQVNPFSGEFTTAQAVLYFGVILFAVFIFCLLLFGSIVIPFRNPRNEDGKVVKMNDLKFVKLFLWFMTYVVAIWITGLASSLTQNFLYFNGANGFFLFIYWILISFLWPIIVCFFLFALIIFWQDQKFRTAINNGLPLK